jgi:drug/metabolite transporter (DMT)-like permease
MFFIKSILGIMLAGSFGAIVSKQINLGNLPWWVGILSSSLGGLIWGWMASQKQSIIMSSTLYDVTMAITYVLVLILLGETLTLTQFWGIVLAVVGIVLVNQ